MQLYSGSAIDFIQETNQNQIAATLKMAYFNYFGFNPSKEEQTSWKNSLAEIKNVFQCCNFIDQGVALEYFLPSTSLRLDCMITGYDENKKETAVIVELKQWSNTEKCDSENEVCTWLGGAKKEVLHPSYQVDRYKQYFGNFYEVFYSDNPIELKSCAYLHNYRFTIGDPILDSKFKDVLEKAPVFSLDDFQLIKDYLLKNVSYGEGLSVLDRINNSKIRPSKKLMDTVANTIKNNKEFILLEEQQIVYDKVFSCVNSFSQQGQKNVLIIEGGPGTGKSVICINLLADLLQKGIWTEYVTGSKAFTTTLRKLAKDNDMFKYTDNYANFDGTSLRGVLLVDEAHRLRKTSSSRYRNTDGKSQVEEIINACNVAVFFVDNNQVVKPNEIGTSDYIEKEAKRLGCTIWKETLQAQFRCSGNEGFVNWINNTLDIHRTANVMLEPSKLNYDFRIFDDPQEMEDELRKKISSKTSARIVAGFAWPWTEYAINGQLANDVVIGNYKRPWNASDKCRGLDKKIPKQQFWATQDGGFDQIGCVYTAQGFEFDYVGVIIGKDMVYDFNKQCYIGHPENSYDARNIKNSKNYLDMIKNVYRVLLSRGMKGCYVYFCDEDTKNFFKSRMIKNQLVF